MSVDRIRAVTFPLARNGYSKRAVDRFHEQLADWLETGRGDPARSELLRRDLARIARRTARLLAEAEQAGQRTRAEARREAERIIERAHEEAARIQAAAERSGSRAAATPPAMSRPPAERARLRSGR